MTDYKKVQEFIKSHFDSNIVKAITQFVEIPNLSRLYDAECKTNGLMEQACKFCMDWAEKQGVKGLSLELLEREGRSPLVFGEIAATVEQDPKTILMYGHIDKQPHLTNQWDEGLHPTKPVIIDGKLYGRGGADDGYAFFASIMIIRTLQEFNIPHDRIVLTFECDEESGSIDMDYYLQEMKEKIQTPDLVVCLDSGTVDYDHFSITTSLRGYCAGELAIKVTKEGVHSGESGIIPDSFRIMRDLLDRVEDSKTGEVIKEFHTEIPESRIKEVKDLVALVGAEGIIIGPFLNGVKSVTSCPVETQLNKTWRPQISYVGIDGLPSCANGGNVLRPATTVKLSVRLPPSTDSGEASQKMKEILEANPPYDSKVEFTIKSNGNGFSAPDYSGDFLKAIEEAALANYGHSPSYFGMGGSIPLMGDLAKSFPNSKFMVTGVLGPKSNAHGPNEFLHLPFLEKMINTMVQMLAEGRKHL